MLTPDEKFLQFLDPDLCDIKETITTGGLRTITLDYKFQTYEDDKQLFRLGNKLWISGDVNLSDALYVVNTSVKQDIFKENSFTCTLEEVLVELNNAPLVSHLDLTTYSSVFKVKTDSTTGETRVKIDWNSLNYWFGDFFNIGVVQDCLNSTIQWIPFFGSFNLMRLLRYIEEETGNVFVTRYEKDLLNNQIHRYLDFLNPINVSKDWELHIEYDFITGNESHYYDENDNEVSDDSAWEVVRYTNSHIDSESIPDTQEPDYTYDVEDTSYQWIAEDEEVVDEGTIKHYDTISNINLANIQFQVTNESGQPLNADGTIYAAGDDNPLIWTPEDLSYTSSDTNALITICQRNHTLGMCTHDKSFAVVTTVGDGEPSYVTYGSQSDDSFFYDVASDNKRDDCVIPDDSFFEIYDTVNHKVLYRTQVNRSIGHVHSEVLDFGFNLDNIQFDIDESDVYTGVAPVLQYNDDNSTSNSMTRANFTDLLTRFRNLKVSKGDKIPMVLQKITETGETATVAATSFGTLAPSNYYIRPYKPQDQIDSTTAENSKWEFIRATAYWNAPFTKDSGSLTVHLDDYQGLEYSHIFGRADLRNVKGMNVYDKIGTTETNDEDIYSIYNACALFLKDHRTPNIELTVDVANLIDGRYNDYDIHDKVYIKLPDTNELITARVIETSKESHDVAANTVKLSNYTTNTIQHITNRTVINASNMNYKYPNSKVLSARLENLDYDNTDYYSVQYPANKLINFTLYKVKDGSRTFMKNYTKVTEAYGYAKLNTKLAAGDYEIDISFGGDEEYSETTTTVKINVAGTIDKKSTTKKTNKSKTNTTKTQNKTTYYDKYGRSPDKKKILAIGKISASPDQGSYANFYGMEFRNYCPHCGKETLVWGWNWANNETVKYAYFSGTKAKEGGNIEGHIFCTNCDADYSCQGNEHVSGGKKLTVTKNRFLSSKTDANKLKKGKYIYNKKTTTTSSKNNVSSKTRKIIGSGISKKVKNLALSIVDNKTGYAAALAISEWMDKNIRYAYYSDFVRSADTVLAKRSGNCCDGTRLFLELCDAAGCSEYFVMEYIQVYGHVYARLTTKKNGKWRNVDCASDWHSAWGYVCQKYQGRAIMRRSKYPKKPF